MTTTTIQRTTTRTTPQPRPRIRPAQARRRGDVAAIAAGIGGGITAAMAAPVVLHTDWTAAGAIPNALGIVAAMAGTYLALLSIVLMARLPWLEHEVGQDRLTAWHRRLGPWTLVLIVAHVVFTTWGYAAAASTGWLSELATMTFTYSWMLPAAVAALLMVGLGVMSWRRIRSRMKYETWHVAHLYFYLAIALGFGHQLDGGSVFVNAPLAKVWWIGLYVGIAAAVVIFRVLMPIVQSLRHAPKVAAVVPVDDETTHVYVMGRDIDRLGAQGGQWFSFRFGTRRWWWQGHPYSLSAAPSTAGLRITVKSFGDQSSELTSLKPGTPVFLEGPYGAFRVDRRRTNRLVMIGAGIGITPIRAMLDELPPEVTADVIYRVHAEPAALVDELRLLEERSNGRIRVHVLAGTRQRYPMTTGALVEIAPRVGASDVYVCGPTAFVDDVCSASAALGVTTDRLHHELFEF